MCFVPMWKLEKDRVPKYAQFQTSLKVGYWIPLDCNRDETVKTKVEIKVPEPTKKTITVPKNVDTTKPLPIKNDDENNDSNDSSEEEKVKYTPSNKKRFISQKELFGLINGKDEKKSEENNATKSDVVEKPSKI